MDADERRMLQAMMEEAIDGVLLWLKHKESTLPTRAWVYGRDVLMQNIWPMLQKSDLNDLDDWFWFMNWCYEEARAQWTKMDRLAVRQELLKWKEKVRNELFTD